MWRWGVLIALPNSPLNALMMARLGKGKAMGYKWTVVWSPKAFSNGLRANLSTGFGPSYKHCAQHSFPCHSLERGGIVEGVVCGI